MAGFEAALAAHPAPRALGDVSLRYEPSMLIGETRKRKPTWRVSALWTAGVSCLLIAVALLLLAATPVLVGSLVLSGAAGIGGAVWLERFEKRQRRFVANFTTVSLRLDFVSAIRGQPRTLVVPFDAVRAVELLRQVDGASCLCVDFARDGALLREVLVAFIPDAQLADAERLERVLTGAFGLGVPPSAGPAEPTLDLSTSRFE